ncbi:MAG: cache domain-containing protein [Verrucomicrobiota bacterium]
MKKHVILGIGGVVAIAIIAWNIIFLKSKPSSSPASSEMTQSSSPAAMGAETSKSYEDIKIEGFDQLAPKEKAVMFVKKAIEYYRANGKEKTIRILNDKQGPFVRGEYYVVMRQLDGLTLAHGGNVHMINKNVLQLTDTDGKYLIKDQIETVKTKGSGWVEYKWINPVSKMVEPKMSYVERVEGEDVYMVCGTYEKK